MNILECSFVYLHLQGLWWSMGESSCIMVYKVQNLIFFYFTTTVHVATYWGSLSSCGTDRGVSEGLLLVETTVRREKPSIRPEDPKPSPMSTPGIELLSFISNRRKEVLVTFQVHASTQLQVGKFCKHCYAMKSLRTVQILAKYSVFIMCAIWQIGRVLTFC